MFSVSYHIIVQKKRVFRREDPFESFRVGKQIAYEFGQQVRCVIGAGIIHDSMKMQTNIIATAEGQIKEICVKEGQQVKAGQLVAVIEQ